jgi:hypothetical protein
MSDFDKLKDEAGKEIKEHPEQVKEGEQAVEKKLGVDSQGDEKAKQDQAGQPPGDASPGDQAGQPQSG